MTTPINLFIQNLKNFENSSYIYDYEELVNSLNELDRMIGMNKIKEQIISQIKFYLVNKYRKTVGLDSHMFHTTLTGPPGCGKTSIAEILAKIWVSLGLIEYKPEVKKVEDEDDGFLNLLNIRKDLDEFRDKIDLLSRNIHEKEYGISLLIEKFNDVNKLLLKIKKKPKNIYINKLIHNISEMKKEMQELLLINSIEPKEKIKIKTENLVVKLRRDDLVAKYVGHTAIKTREVLNKSLGKVIFIDEAYELYNCLGESSNDSFGMECLNTILSFMNEHSSKCIIIFAGYEDLLQKTIFRIQPGLQRRISWTFNIEKYSPSELIDIYEKQLKDNKWNLIEKNKLLPLFTQNKEYFKFGGGDTLRLAIYTKTVYSDVNFIKLLNNEIINSDITFDIVRKSIDILKSNQEKKDELPFGMYV